MSPAAIAHPIPAALGYCAVIDEFLSAAECRSLIELAERHGFGSAALNYPPTYRNNDRLVHDDADLASRFYERLRPFAPAVIERGVGERWHLQGVNDRLRFCRYRPQQQFNIHQDGIHHRNTTHRSLLTFMVYLTDGADFSGGDTEFFADGPGATPVGDTRPEVVARVRPRIGTLILFDHAIWHAGAQVTAGTKHIVRSDVLYRCDPPSCPEDVSQHRGYVWSLAALSGGKFASGGRDCSIRIWTSPGTLATVLTGHSQSVLGLARLDESHLASVSRDKTLRIWNIPEARCTVCVPAHEAAVLTVADLGHGTLATASADHSIKLWNSRGGSIATLEAHAGWVWKVASLNANVFASASEDGTVKLWDAQSHAHIRTLPGNTPLRALAISPDGRTLATGDVAGMLRVWTDVLRQPRIEAEIKAHDAAVRCATFIDSSTLASGGEDCRLHVWSGKPWRSIYQGTHENFVTDILSIRPRYCLSASYDGAIRLHQWSVHS